MHMVTAALRISLDIPREKPYTTSGEGHFDVLNTLNWYEAQKEYTWPDFSDMGADFTQTMRFRRQLVTDVFAAMQKAGHVRVRASQATLGTPDSSRERKEKRAGDSIEFPLEIEASATR